jgi:hypothetical protein
VAEKREGQGGRAPDATKAGAKLVFDLVKIVRAEVGELGAFDVAPHELDRVEVRRVAGQALDREPGTLRAHVRLHRPTLVRRQSIPDQDDAATSELSLQVVQEFDEGHIVVTARARLKEKTTAAEIPPERQGQGDGQLLPVEGVDQDGGGAARRPRAADRGPLRDAALVLEDDPGPSTPSVFFTAGQRVVIQCWIAASFRSLARLAGRCNVQSSAPKSRQTCPG